MNRRIYLLIVASFVLASSAHAADKPAGKVLIDASKDGGEWWYPQGKDFDAEAPHQGKPIADALRAKGFEVKVLGRGEKVTAELLGGASVVLRPRTFFPYAPAELEAYHEAIAGGLPVVMMAQPASRNDQLGKKLGFEFGDFQELGGLYGFRKHGLADGLTKIEGPWASITKLPEGATAIGSMQSGRAIAALSVVDKGAVVVLGSLPKDSAAPIVNLMGLLSSTPASKLKKELDESKGEVQASAGPFPPELETPAEKALLPQGEGAAWHFQWAAAEKATQYQLLVYGPSASIPLINLKTDKLTHGHKVTGVIIDRNKPNWSWSVRARDADGNWGDWSITRKFDVE